MAEQLPPQDDPVTSKSLALPYLIATVLLLGTLLWAIYDENWGTRPWKGFQTEFKDRYETFLKSVKSRSASAEKDLMASSDYQALQADYDRISADVKPKVDEINKEVNKVNQDIGIVQTAFVDARAHVSADTYDLETTVSDKGRENKKKELDAYKAKKQFTIELPDKGKLGPLDYNELEQLYLGLKDQKARLVAQIADITKPQKDAQVKMSQYLADNMVDLSPGALDNLRKANRDWDPKIVQINVNAANLVDRCESCHMGARQPIEITPAAMMAKGKKPDAYALAFVSHPERQLLALHDPEKFGCAPCHGGNGRATSSVEKAHGNYEHWLYPLWKKENVDAGCQTCHAADRVLAAPGGPELGKTIDLGKDMFRNRGCNGCHRYEGYDKEPEDVVFFRQQMKQLESQQKDNLHQAAILTKKGDTAGDNTEANAYYQQAENLRVENSVLAGKIEQFDLQMRSALHDMKKIGPNLKDIRAKLNKNWIPVWLKKPTDFRPGTKMPNFRLDDQDIKAISAYLWQSALTDSVPKAKSGDAGHGKELLETRGCLACHSIGEGSGEQGGTFAANLSRLGEKANLDYIARWVHNPRLRLRPYCPYEKKDLGPEDYAKKGLPYVFDEDHSICPNDGHQLQYQQMTVMPILRLSESDAADVATFLMSQKKKDPADYPDAPYMDDARLKDLGRAKIRQYGCAGCHEINGFEDEGRIGTELTQEGSKPIERLDFALLTEEAKRGGPNPVLNQKVSQNIGPWYGGKYPSNAKEVGPWYDTKGFFERKLLVPNLFDYDIEGRVKVKKAEEYLRMPDPHLTDEQRNAIVTMLLGSQDPTVPADYRYQPRGTDKDIQEGWWIVKKYNCMGCHQFVPGQPTVLMGMTRYQDPDWKEQLPPKLLTEGARVDPVWLMKFLRNPALSDTDTNRNGVRPYLKVHMPTFFLSDNELRKLVRFFQALSQQPMPYIPQKDERLTAKEMEMGRSLFSSAAAPCLKCHATGDPNHDRTATAPNFLMAKERLKPGWMERWITDPQAISPGTSMPSGLFHKQGEQMVFSGPIPPAFEGYTGDHTKLLVRYMMQLTPDEQRRVAAMMGRAPAPSGAKPNPSEKKTTGKASPGALRAPKPAIPPAASGASR
ncbi:MAG: cytochrome c [Candidatus Koribacter versatilis]|uniref:Cytochrome c n=1 Tax=Candidatus Korobacter versatilis TaxID=658062 RepID=A0A932A638_9BACT|nr:cytochrome c [Candidatus Koribacter versatilis]